MSDNCFNNAEQILNNIDVRTKTLFFKNYRKTKNILNDVSKKWNELNKDDRDDLSKLLAGEKLK